jgi:hypothetical protein
MSRRLIWFPGSLSLTTVVVYGQRSSVGSITGSVVDPSGAGISGAAISIRNINTNQGREPAKHGIYWVSYKHDTSRGAGQGNPELTITKGCALRIPRRG